MSRLPIRIRLTLVFAGVMAVVGEEFGDTQDAVRNAIDVGGEGLGDDRDPHGHTVRHLPIAVSQPP